MTELICEFLGLVHLVFLYSKPFSFVFCMSTEPSGPQAHTHCRDCEEGSLFESYWLGIACTSIWVL